MLDKLSEAMDFQAKALLLRSDRQRLIAGNIANADTPGYAGRDIDFQKALAASTGEATTKSKLTLAMAPSQGSSIGTLGSSGPSTLALGGMRGTTVNSGDAEYTVEIQPSIDNNSVDLDRERAAFAENAIRYEATLRFINGQAKTLQTAITGQ